MSEREPIREELRRHEEQIRLINESVVDYAIVMLDPDGRVVSWNDGAEQVTGYSAEEIVGKHCSAFYPREDIERGKPGHELELAAAEGRAEDDGWRVRKDGSVFWASVTTTATRDEAGDLRGYTTMTRDLTANKQAQNELWRSEAALRMMIESVVDHAIFMLDPSGRVVNWNAGAQRIKGYRAEEIIGQHFSRFYPQEDIERGKPQRELEIAVLEGRFGDEGWRVRNDGSRFWANVTISAVRDEAGELRGFTKLTRDMTQRRAYSLSFSDVAQDRTVPCYIAIRISDRE